MKTCMRTIHMYIICKCMSTSIGMDYRRHKNKTCIYTHMYTYMYIYTYATIRQTQKSVYDARRHAARRGGAADLRSFLELVAVLLQNALKLSVEVVTQPLRLAVHLKHQTYIQQ